MSTSSSLTSKAWLESAQKQLEIAGIATARLDCLVLLQDELGADKSSVLAHPELVLPSGSVKNLNKRLQRRLAHEPLAYIRGKSEFYGREFLVSRDTLEPRPETETMIDFLKEIRSYSQNSPLLKDSPFTEGRIVIVDVGTGSGCLAVTAKAEFAEVRVMAIDISPACLKIARQNAKNLKTAVRFLRGDLLEPVYSAKVNLEESVILANLPYVPDAHTINPAAMHEPELAIFGGFDGLELYRRLFGQIAKNSQKPRHVLTESLPFQHTALAEIARLSGYTLSKTEDFVQLFTAEERLQA